MWNNTKSIIKTISIEELAYNQKIYKKNEWLKTSLWVMEWGVKCINTNKSEDKYNNIKPTFKNKRKTKKHQIISPVALVFFLKGYSKRRIYATQPASVEDLRQRITNECLQIYQNRLQNVRECFQQNVYNCMEGGLIVGSHLKNCTPLFWKLHGLKWCATSRFSFQLL